MAVDRAIDITAEERKTVLSLLEQHLPGTPAWVYGSRANWTSRHQSDLDLVVFPKPEQRQSVGDLREAFEESNLPFRVDLFVWDEVPESFRKQIESDHSVFTTGSEPFGARDTSPPENWDTMPFNEAFLVNPAVRIERGTTTPFVDMAAVKPGLRSVRSTKIRTFRGSGSRFQSGDTLMARITPCLENGKIGRYRADSDKEVGHGSTEFIVIRGRPGITDSEYAFYVTRSAQVRGYAIDQMTGTSGRQRVPTESLSYLDVVVPPVPEQRAIAHVLGTLDDKIELNRRMNATLEAMARALFKSWFIDFDPVRAKMEGRHTGLPQEVADLFADRLVDSKLGETPQGWIVSALGDMIELAYGKALKAEARNSSGRVPVFGSNGQIGWHNKALVQGPGIVVGRKGNPGTVTLSPTEFFPIDTTFYVVPKHPHVECPYFLFLALREQDLPAVAADSAVPGLNRNLAYMNKQLSPPTSVVECFNSYVSNMYASCRQAATESRLLAELRDTLLPKLVSGELPVTGMKSASETDERPGSVGAQEA